MSSLNRRDGRLFIEDVDLSEVAERWGTPCYVYSRADLESGWRAFDEALAGVDHQVCYAVKANSNLAVLNLLARLGAGFDIVSGGELLRVLAAGGEPASVVFSGVGKTEAELEQALDADIGLFNVESPAELDLLQAVAARHGRQAPVALRVNPDVDPSTHPYISTGLKENKFGIPAAQAQGLYRRAAEMSNIRLVGIACHIGSQLVSLAPYLDALQRLLGLVDALAADGIALEHLDLGGGLGIRYRDEEPPSPQDFGRAVINAIGQRPLRLMIEPGRAISGPAGVLLTRVLYLKSGEDREFAVVDAAMNDLLRPALYQAWHDVVPLVARSDVPEKNYQVVGPVCETGDFLGQDRRLSVAAGDGLAVCGAGAYAFVMSSNYNSRPRACEIMVDGSEMHLVREREDARSLMDGESVLPA
ncbi:MAG: diaminopimelate decarboxylase [Gammaproteobacteria bacterium]|nr:MAG: diaminopimelate decarboxylase [Gammaproteobacteria bacterium]